MTGIVRERGWLLPREWVILATYYCSPLLRGAFSAKFTRETDIFVFPATTETCLCVSFSAAFLTNFLLTSFLTLHLSWFPPFSPMATAHRPLFACTSECLFFQAQWRTLWTAQSFSHCKYFPSSLSLRVVPDRSRNAAAVYF